MYPYLRRKRQRQRALAAFGSLLLVALLALAAALANNETPPATTTQVPRVLTPATGEAATPPARANGPQPIRGIYLTAQSASGKALEEHLRLLDQTELNAVVVDVKDVTGEVMYASDVPLAREIGATRNVLRLRSLVERLERHNVYAIARVATFEDDILPRRRPDLAVKNSATGDPWANYGGVTWSDPYNREVWEYNVAIAREAARAGFDEVQFDYVRFPSDGPMEQLRYEKRTFPTREEAIAGFLRYARGELKPLGVRVAADVFGLAATLDAGVGQDVAAVAPYLDVICPMVYPSHFPSGSYGLPDPNASPHATIKNALADFNEKAEAVNPRLEIRPWLQDFDYGTPPYGPAEVRAQVRATYDSGATGWLLWNPLNEYTEKALAPEAPGEPGDKRDRGAAPKPEPG